MLLYYIQYPVVMFCLVFISDELQATTESPTETVHTEYANSKEILEATTTNAVYLENADSNESDVSLESHIAPTQCQPGASSIHEHCIICNIP